MAAPNVFDNYIRVRPASGMSEFTVLELPVAASQTIATYDFLSLSGGLVQQAIAAPAAGASTASGGNLPIVGIAMAPIVTTSAGIEVDAGINRTTTTVAILDDRLNVLLRVAGTNGVSKTLANVSLGGTYQLARYTNAAGTFSWYFLDQAVTTNGELVIQEIPADLKIPGSTSYQTYTWPNVWCKAAFSATIRQLA